MRVFIVLWSVFLLLSCSQKQNGIKPKPPEQVIVGQEPSESIEQKLVLQISTTPCFGECPVYDLSIFSNRVVTFNGKKFTKINGSQTGVITFDQYEKLLEKAKKAKLMEAEDVYDNPAITDLPSTKILFIQDGTKKSIVARYEVPENITKFIDYTYELMDQIKWDKNQVD